MTITGRIEKAEGGLWRAECPLVGAYTQGKSRKDALVMLADCIEALIGHDGVRVLVTDSADENARNIYDVSISANDASVLLAEVLRHQRRVHKLTLAEVAKRLGAKNANAYAAYEQGKRKPSLSKYIELLGIVAPEMAMMVGPRAATKRKAVGTTNRRTPRSAARAPRSRAR
jgi:predicted RNase H-like HicB family nuclease